MEKLLGINCNTADWCKKNRKMLQHGGICEAGNLFMYLLD